MLCKLSRWMISRAEDTGKKLPRIAARHVGRCSSCDEFARSSASLSLRLRAERSAWLAQVPDLTPGPAHDTEPSRATPRAVEAGRSGSLRPRAALRPLPIAAAALVVLAGMLVLFQVVLREPPPNAQDRAAAMAALKTLSSGPDRLQGVIGEAESSLERERRILEQSVTSAVEYLQARLNIRIERKDAARSF
jgi:hypothetical protein